MYNLAHVLFASFALLAGRVFAMNITLNAAGIVNVTETQFLTVNDASLQSVCNPQACTDANNTINACAGNTICLCQSDTVVKITKCQQCYFEQLITENRPIPGGDIRAGGQTALAAYATACNASNNVLVPANETTLKAPANLHGPFEQLLTTGTTAITIIAALTIGSGAIGTLIFM